MQGGKPPLLFLHGSGHAAWCWKVSAVTALTSILRWHQRRAVTAAWLMDMPVQERFTPFFADRGYDSYALSLRGQGGSTVPRGVKPLSLEANAADVADFVTMLPAPPVVVAHSFGGLVLQKRGLLPHLCVSQWHLLTVCLILPAMAPKELKLPSAGILRRW
jgi:pimeloyl-ACP methyl ester carboxylesterase